MKRKILRAVSVAAITGAGLFAFSAPAAAHGGGWGGGYGAYNSYDDGYGYSRGGMYSGYNFGAFNGNQFSSVFQAPISVCGNSIAILGFASSSCRGGAFAYNGGW